MYSRPENVSKPHGVINCGNGRWLAELKQTVVQRLQSRGKSILSSMNAPNQQGGEGLRRLVVSAVYAGRNANIREMTRGIETLDEWRYGYPRSACNGAIGIEHGLFDQV